MDNQDLYNYNIIQVKKTRILKLRRSLRGKNGKQDVISLGVKEGEIKDDVEAIAWARSIVLKHESGAINWFDKNILKPKNIATIPDGLLNTTITRKCVDVFAECKEWIQLHMSQEKRNSQLGIVNETRSSTSRTYLQRFNQFEKYIYSRFGTKVCMSQISHISVYENWADEMTRIGLSSSTISGRFFTISSIFKQMRLFETYGISEVEFKTFMTSKRVVKSTVNRIRENEYFSETDFPALQNGWKELKLKNSASAKYENLFWFLLYSGTRINIESKQIQLKEIDFEGKRVNLKLAWSGAKTTSDWLKLAPQALEILKKQIDEQGISSPDDFVFANIDYYNFRECLKKYIPRWVPNKKANPHILRHTFATLLLSHGVSVWTVANLLRHKDTTMIEQVYGHIIHKPDDDIFLNLPDLPE